jgi:hypothetical protein
MTDAIILHIQNSFSLQLHSMRAASGSFRAGIQKHMN